MPVSGGPEQQIAESIYQFNYAITEKGVCVTRNRSIAFVNFSTGEIRPILTMPRPDAGLTVSPDGRCLLFSQVDAVRSDLMLIRNFFVP